MPGALIGRNVRIHRAIIGDGAYIADGSSIVESANKLTVIGAGEFRYSRSPLLRSRQATVLDDVRMGS